MTDTLNQMLTDFEASANHIRAALTPSKYCTTVASHNWIVVDEVGPLRFEVTKTGRKEYYAEVTGRGSAMRVNRFEKKAALELADAIGGVARFWEDVAREELESLENCISRLKTAN